MSFSSVNAVTVTTTGSHRPGRGEPVLEIGDLSSDTWAEGHWIRSLCGITNGHKLSGFERHGFIISVSIGQKSGRSGSHRAKLQALARLPFFLAALGKNRPPHSSLCEPHSVQAEMPVSLAAVSLFLFLEAARFPLPVWVPLPTETFPHAGSQPLCPTSLLPGRTWSLLKSLPD